jgi:hypothetical protein
MKKNEKGGDEERQEDDEERKESEECLLQHPWRGNFSPQFMCTETYTHTQTKIPLCGIVGDYDI